MKKNVLNLWLLAALLCGLSLSVTSCKDDDKDDTGDGNDPGQVTSPADTDEAKAAYNWLANMTDIDDFTDDWASKTYEPTIGVESQNQANTRIVVVADIDYAKMNFASISGLALDQLSATQSQTIPDVGTITWTPSATGASNLATVDVNTKLIPHLSKIVYCTVEQVGDNFGGSYEGTAFYRFGDVIEDTEGYYWVCVKPAFGTGRAPQQQGYWMNILNRDSKNGRSNDGEGPVPPIPAKNMCSDYDEQYNGNTILLPTKLKSTKEMTHGLANLVWALLDPEAYHKTVGDNGIGLGGYDYKYNGAQFCQRVADQWKEKMIWEKLFNRTYEQMKQMKKLNFYYEGYHFTPKIHNGSSNLGCAVVMGTERYEKAYVTTNSQDGKKNIEMKEKGAGFDMRRYCSDPQQDVECASSGKAGYAPKEQFTTREGYWIVRMKTSTDIAGTKLRPSVYATLSNTSEIYRYNQAYKRVVGSEAPVEEERAEGVNNTFFALGDVVKDTDGNRWFCIQPSSYDGKEGHDFYAYFISLDENAVGENLERVQSEHLLIMQMLYDLNILYHNYIKNPDGAIGKAFQNIREYADVSIDNLFGVRDTTVISSTTERSETMHMTFISTLYRSDHDNELYVLRSHGDIPASDRRGPGVDRAWIFDINYTKEPKRQMKLTDLADQKIISDYNEDEWVSCPWYERATRKISMINTGVRTNTEMITPLSNFIYKMGRTALFGSVPANMYREPIIPFAVMRAVDTGSNYAFEDGKAYTKVKYMKDDLSFSTDAQAEIVNLLYHTDWPYIHDGINFGVMNMDWEPKYFNE